MKSKNSSRGINIFKNPQQHRKDEKLENININLFQLLNTLYNVYISNNAGVIGLFQNNWITLYIQG